MRWSELVKENADDLAKIMTLESGKPLNESYGEVSYGASYIDFYAAEALRPTSAGGGLIIPTPFARAPVPVVAGENKQNVNVNNVARGTAMVIHQGVGVCGIISPWNFPFGMFARKVAPALAAGCTAIVKPSEHTPLIAVAAQYLAECAGVPEGVFEVITADRDNSVLIGDAMCAHSAVKKVSFTGSTDVGKLLMKKCSDTVKRVSLELGGNAAFIVFEDADIDEAVAAAMSSKFRNAGQTCVCADRFLVHAAVEEEFISKFVEAAKMLKVGVGIDESVTLTPLITATAVRELSVKVAEAIEEGAQILTGGNSLPNLGANYFEATILNNVNRESRLWRSETFGPIAAITTFSTEDEAVDLANDTKSGLAAYVMTRDAGRIFRVIERLENGLVGVNEGVISSAYAPFGGVKESGLGREGSSIGIGEYIETKYVFLNH